MHTTFLLIYIYYTIKYFLLVNAIAFKILLTLDVVKILLTLDVVDENSYI